jgi:hypothetical protein
MLLKCMLIFVVMFSKCERELAAVMTGTISAVSAVNFIFGNVKKAMQDWK